MQITKGLGTAQIKLREFPRFQLLFMSMDNNLNQLKNTFGVVDGSEKI